MRRIAFSALNARRTAPHALERRQAASLPCAGNAALKHYVYLHAQRLPHTCPAAFFYLLNVGNENATLVDEAHRAALALLLSLSPYVALHNMKKHGWRRVVRRGGGWRTVHSGIERHSTDSAVVR